MVDSSVVTISDTGLVSAASSIGSYNYRTVIVFVRNGDYVASSPSDRPSVRIGSTVQLRALGKES
jgi:hypothetical protein